jgi:hypothetical protein
MLLRPVGSCCFALAGFLHNILSALINNTNSYMKMLHFKLLTNVLAEEVLEMVENKLQTNTFWVSYLR